jgi:excisionase family DNA binding protein
VPDGDHVGDGTRKDQAMDDQDKIQGTEARDVSRVEELLKQETYTPEEAADVLNMSQRTILSSAFGGELKARIVNGDIVEITRTDLVDWIRRRES